MTASGSSQPTAQLTPADPAITVAAQVGTVEVFVADEQDDVTIDTDRWLRLAAQVLAAQGVTGAHGRDVEMSLYFVDEAAISALNAQYMGKEGPTDVLSFPIDGEDAAAPSAGRAPDNSPKGPNDDRFDEADDEQPFLVGDVLVCPLVAQRNAAEHLGPHHDGTVDDELALLVVHGILHLLGMDHMVESEAEAMESRERVLLHTYHRPILSDDELAIEAIEAREAMADLDELDSPALADGAVTTPVGEHR